ncbi:MAG: VanW family protein [Armatimonadota bacterium]
MKVFMKRGGIVLVGSLAVVSIVVAAVVQGTEAKLVKGSQVGVVEVGGLTQVEAQKKLRLWWETAKLEKLTLTIKDKSLKKTFTPGELGISIDDVASIAQIPIEGLVGQVLTKPEISKFPLKTKPVLFDIKTLNASVKESYGDPGPARVKFVSGKIVREPEKPRFTLDDSALPEAVVKGILDDQVVTIPIKEEPKRITDEVLNQITDVVSEFSTNFSADNRPRSNNIRLASGKLNGIVIMPGEKMGFNETVGERTLKGGYKVAGVYVNGKHDTGIGGGICQVSTTLYNASLFANLKVLERSNHSMPVPYVPLGRDATVNYGAQNLVIENSTTTPIVVASQYQPGKLTFRILGKKEEGLEVKIFQGRVRSSGASTRREFDPRLAPGTTKVQHNGDNRYVQTFRTVYKNGVKVGTETLKDSFYNGGGTIISYGPKAPPKPAAPPAPTPSAPPTEAEPADGV